MSLAALAEGAALSQDNTLIPGELALRAHHKELQTEYHNACFRIQYHYNQRIILQDQMQKVLEKLNTHYPST